VADGGNSLFATLEDDWRGDVRPSELTSAPVVRERQPIRPQTDEGRFIGLDSDADSPFLRAQKRVPVRRGPVTRKTANRLKQGCIAAAVLAAGVFAATWIYRYAELAPRFRIESSHQILVSGTQNVSRSQILEAFGADIGRNVFFIPIGDRKRQLERIPWVQSAAVMRLLPNQLGVAIEERKPLAFAQVGSRVLLVDSEGVLLDLPASSKAKYSFPVIIGMAEAEPHSTRAARMRIYSELVRELDSGGARYSEDLSEVDLRDPEDVKITVADDDGAVLIHLGDSNFLEHYKTYISHIQGWRQQYHKIEAVDLRFDRQIIVHPESSVGAAPASAPPAVTPHANSSKTSRKPASRPIGSHGQSTAHSHRH
jgi:cell division protein FtsQ